MALDSGCWLARAVIKRGKNSVTKRYEWQNKAAECFPGCPKRIFLSRLDVAPLAITYHVCSQEKPIRPSWCAIKDWSVEKIVVKEGSLYSFSLIANPLKTIVGEEGSRRGSKVIVEQVELLPWLRRKCAQAGIALVEPVDVQPLRYSYFGKPSDHWGLESVAEWHGTLRIEDGAKFLENYPKGMGGAKNFHCGLLILDLKEG